MLSWMWGWGWSVWEVLGWAVYLRARGVIKWLLRRCTRLCELQRVCYGAPPGAARCAGIENSFALTRTTRLRQLVHYLDEALQDRETYQISECAIGAVEIVMHIKRIDPQVHPQFPVSLHRCIEQIWSYKLLVRTVEELRITQYDSDDLDHETKLLELWKALMPNEPLEGRITKQWQDIGFQGDDPKTDFRGMGMLGLENLLYFATEFPQASSHVLSHSHHPTYGYTFAVVGINLTSMAYHFLKDNSAKTYFYNCNYSMPCIKLFHRFYCYLFYEFDKLWIESKPKDIMEFSMIFKRFENIIRNELADPASVFRINLEVDNV